MPRYRARAGRVLARSRGYDILILARESFLDLTFALSPPLGLAAALSNNNLIASAHASPSGANRLSTTGSDAFRLTRGTSETPSLHEFFKGSAMDPHRTPDFRDLDLTALDRSPERHTAQRGESSSFAVGDPGAACRHSALVSVSRRFHVLEFHHETTMYKNVFKTRK